MSMKSFDNDAVASPTDADTDAPSAPISRTHLLSESVGATAEIPPMVAQSIEYVPPTASSVAATSPTVKPHPSTNVPIQISPTRSHLDVYVNDDRIREYALGRVPLTTPLVRPKRQVRRPLRYRE